ncbi:uncharacterized protein K444DRAFT_530196, partial [Hyaloscypha bicolor E]
TTEGISLLISALVQIKTLTFYHLHLVYDTVSFVAISNCAAAVCSLDPKTTAGIVRYYLIAIWSVLYLTYTSLFGKRLQSWDYSTPGHCYNTHHLALPSARHPSVDNVYIAITCFYIFATISLATGFTKLLNMSEDSTSTGLMALFSKRGGLPWANLYTRATGLFSRMGGQGRWSRGLLAVLENLQETKVSDFLQHHRKPLLLVVTFVQFPVHVYSIFMLRKSNEGLLISGHTEQEWGFGQVAAMVLLAPNVIGIVVAVNG